MIQQLSPLLGLNATTLNLTEAQYDQLMSRPTFINSPSSTAETSTTAEREVTRLEDVSLVIYLFIFRVNYCSE